MISLGGVRGGGRGERRAAGAAGKEDCACACGSPKARGVDGQGEGGGAGIDGAGPRFPAVLGDAPWLDGEYTVFGMVTEGRDTVDRLASVELEGGRFPEQPAGPSETRVRTVLVP